MDNRILAVGGALALALVAGVGGWLAFSSGGNADEVAAVGGAEAPAKDGKTGKTGKAGAGNPVDLATDEAGAPEGGPLKAAKDQEKDPEYEQRALAARQRREAVNAEWRVESTAAAQQWLAANVPDEAKSARAMGAFMKMHDVIAQSRRDMEDGVIHPRVLREEMDMAKADARVELENILGPEQSSALLEHLTQGNLGGI